MTTEGKRKLGIKVVGWLLVGSVCVVVGLVLLQVLATLFGGELSLLKSSEFWSAIAGAVVGGGIAAVIQLIALAEGRQQRKQDYERVQQGLASALVFKLIRINSTFVTINNHMQTEYAKLTVGHEPWEVVMPIASPSPRVNFTAHEMGMLLAQKDDKVFNSVVELDDKHNTLIGRVEEYAVCRQDLWSRLPAPVAAQGAVGFGQYTPQQKLALSPFTSNVNSLADGAKDLAADGAQQSTDALEQTVKLLRAQGLISFGLGQP